MQQRLCSRCGLAQGDWQGNDGQGVDAGGQTYCCRGCAAQTGCTCTPRRPTPG